MGQHFPVQDTKKQIRIINRDGTINTKKNARSPLFSDLYHQFISSSWPKFTTGFLTTYIVANLLFAFFYWLLPISEFDGLFTDETRYSHFWQCFFFSVQTFGTIGYGKVSPIGFSANIIVTLESMTSLFLVALATGLIFARFSKPIAKILFSNSSVIRKFEDGPWFMFRIANERQNHITDARVNVTFVYDEANTGYRTFKELPLELNVNPIFALSWVIAHQIDEKSPMFGLTLEQFRSIRAEIIVTFNGTDTTLSQSVSSKFSYTSDEILIDHDFVDVISRNKDGTLSLMLEKFHLVKPFIQQ